ncbi:monooxygenase [Lophiostoma macrostomum CBS 122681]|uniref:Monooxygenase n=1 Tax=Lophiostoma macrostomum CBS 122681 TaxID=1314788 RepID=A0A6A6SUC8_9PLEO|nr:monooxygenase [Lophiostoma macrostomum CBS 122681]
MSPIPLNNATFSLLLGTFAHVSLLKNFELDTWIPLFFVTSLASLTSLIFYHVHYDALSPAATLFYTVKEATCFLLGVFTSMTIYRLFFHRIRHFPGPILARVTRFYNLYLSGKNVKYYDELDKLHNQYGDFIRTGPREISILRKSAVSLIYGPQSACLKSTWYSAVSNDSAKAQMFYSRDPVDHKRRRKAWDRAFSVKSLRTYAPLIRAKVEQLTSTLASSATAPKDATAWMMMLAFDIMGEVGYGQDFGGIDTGKEHPAAKAIHDHMTILSVVGTVPWLLYLLQFIPGASKGYAPFFKWSTGQIQGKKATWNPEKEPKDIASWLIKAVMEKDVSASPTTASLNDDGRLIIIAGSDTSASANACTLYYLASNPHILAKLQSRLDAAMPNGPQDWSYDSVASINYLDDVIKESLRLKPPVITGGYRVTPPEGLQVDEVYIPGDVNVIVPIQLIHTDKKYWKKPLDYIPERWGERKEELGTDETLFMPFSQGLTNLKAIGVYKCVGDKMAMISMRIAISSIVQQFDLRLASGETGEAFDKERKDAFTTVLKPLQLLFVPRKKFGKA